MSESPDRWPEPELIVFDCDGVLIDSWDSTCFYYNRILDGLGLPRLTPEDEAFVFTSSVAEGLRRVVPRHMLPMADQAVKDFRVQDLLPLVKVEPGVRLFLRFITDRGIRAAVNTNGGRENKTILHELGLGRFFDLIVTADDVDRPKPYPDGVLKILEAVRVPSFRAVYIGDSEVDRKTAHSAGLLFGSYKNPNLPADFHLSGFSPDAMPWGEARVPPA